MSDIEIQPFMSLAPLWHACTLEKCATLLCSGRRDSALGGRLRPPRAISRHPYSNTSFPLASKPAAMEGWPQMREMQQKPG